ncbi:methionyl-tRNA formyltransferase [Sphaerisporangium krabiense]|uniref:Methionyl-tRNA formyltransferase n=1 Tax=Sphaerisporangium krabiense TaxID=763782 RepID=A0A7W8Z864_9ACTN|nr:methionyl-tRNA formyltransferase [Sphaerisporangium krabiense]MBB5629247.1 methionyl-tRNA formyltransferase [Sphaerisporangium krabiense]GII67020.1 methionyl-tRNA formyltransferase [Sphaerisporangium krabiense]
MRLVFAGTPETALPSLRALLDSPRHEVAAVVTRPDAQSGRGRRVQPSPVAELAASAGVEVLRPAKAGDPDFLARLKAIAPDCCPVVAYGALLPQAALDVPRLGWINLHFSLLPAWRGAAPVQHAVLHGDEITGAATFQIVKELDAGPVYGVVTEEVRPADTSGELLARLAESGAGLLLATLDGVEDGELVARPQPADGVSHAPKLEVSDARVDWTAPALRVDRLVRACTPAPGAWTEFRGERLKLGPVTLVAEGAGPVPGAGPLGPGEIAAAKNTVLVGTSTRPVLLGEVQPEGKRRMTAGEWARGVRLTPADRLG